MGISDINPFLREKCPRVFIKRRLTEFNSKRIAFDTNNWMFRMMAIAHKKVVDQTDVCNLDPDRDAISKIWISSMMESIATFLSYGITPVFVFDGVYPEKKTKTKLERRKIKDNVRARIDALREELVNGDVLLRSAAKMEELRKLVRQLFYVGRPEEESFRNLLVGLGLPCVQAAGEAEQLCSMLCRQGKVTAVYSADTDNLPYGCPFLISELLHEYEYGADGAGGTSTEGPSGARFQLAMTVKIDDVLRELDITHAQFVDFCIMLGCDYNESISQIGSTRAFNLIKKYGSIEAIPRLASNPSRIDRDAVKCGLPRSYKGVEMTYDTRVLDYEFCRNQFGNLTQESLRGQGNGRDEEPVENNKLDVDKSVFRENARDILGMYDLLRMLQKLHEIYVALPAPQDDVVPATTTPTRLQPPAPTITLVTEGEAVRPRPRLVIIPGN